LLVSREFVVSYETIRQWCKKYGNIYSNQLENNCGQLVYNWYLDEVFIKINGVLHYLWRAVGQDGDEIDILVQKRKNKAAAIRFFNRLLKGQGGGR